MKIAIVVLGVLVLALYIKVYMLYKWLKHTNEILFKHIFNEADEIRARKAGEEWQIIKGAKNE